MSAEIVIPDDGIADISSEVRGLKLTNGVTSSGMDQTDAAEEAQPLENDQNERFGFVINPPVARGPTFTPPNIQSSASYSLTNFFSSSTISTSSSSLSNMSVSSSSSNNTLINNTSISSSTSSINDQSPRQQGIYFHQLKEKHKSSLSALLDQRNTSGIPHWHHVMENMFDAREESTVKIADLYRAQHGGGNPPLQFLENLIRRKENVTKEDFRAKARKSYIERYDVANHPVLADREGSMLIKSLTIDEMLTLAALLTPSNNLADWKYFADEYDFTDELKDTIATSINANVTSPTKQMLEFLKTKEKTTNDLKLACENISIPHVVSLIDEIENELSIH